MGPTPKFVHLLSSGGGKHVVIVQIPRPGIAGKAWSAMSKRVFVTINGERVRISACQSTSGPEFVYWNVTLPSESIAQPDCPNLVTIEGAEVYMDEETDPRGIVVPYRAVGVVGGLPEYASPECLPYGLWLADKDTNGHSDDGAVMRGTIDVLYQIDSCGE